MTHNGQLFGRLDDPSVCLVLPFQTTYVSADSILVNEIKSQDIP